MKLGLQNAVKRLTTTDDELLPLTSSENFEEIFQLIKGGITKENIKLRELIPSRLQRAATIDFFVTGELYKSYVYEYYSFYSTMNSSTFTSFQAFVFFVFSSLIKKLIS